MNLDDVKRQKVTAWIEQGLKLSEIQSKLASELDVHLTYMEVRLLVDDLKLLPKDQPAPQPVRQISAQPPGREAESPEEQSADEPFADELPGTEAGPQPGSGNVSVSVDHVARPGALVSGQVTFGDGQTAAWYLDQMGRLGIVPKQQGYRPSPQDVQTFQLQLQNELQKLGF